MAGAAGTLLVLSTDTLPYPTPTLTPQDLQNALDDYRQGATNGRTPSPGRLALARKFIKVQANVYVIKSLKRRQMSRHDMTSEYITLQANV